jgi:hypothetical protein
VVEDGTPGITELKGVELNEIKSTGRKRKVGKPSFPDSHTAVKTHHLRLRNTFPGNPASHVAELLHLG